MAKLAIDRSDRGGPIETVEAVLIGQDLGVYKRKHGGWTLAHVPTGQDAQSIVPGGATHKRGTLLAFARALHKATRKEWRVIREASTFGMHGLPEGPLVGKAGETIQREAKRVAREMGYA